MEVAASVVGLLAVGAKISSALQQFISGCTNAPAIAQSIYHEVHDFSFVLSKLQPIVLGAAPLNVSRASLVDVDHLSFTLIGCVCTFSGLEKEISHLKAHGRFGVWDRIKWSRTEKTISEFIQRLQSHKLSLTLILTILTCESPTEATSCQHSLHEQLVGGIPGMPGQDQLGVGSLPGVVMTHPENDNLNSSTDDSDSVMATARSRHVGFYRLAFESTLFVSRPYRGVSNESVLSLASSKRAKGRWSLFSGGSNRSVFFLPLSMNATPGVSLAEISGVSLAEIPSVSTFSLSIPQGDLYNPSWYDGNTTDPSLLRFAITPEEDELLGLTASGRETPQSLLHSAARNGLRRIVQLLIDRGVSIKALDKEGNTLLHLAALGGHETTVQLLLGRGANIEARSGGMNTPLHLAAKEGHEVTVQLLLDGGASTEAKSRYGYTPLHLTVSKGYGMMVQLLLGGGANIEARDGDMNTPLHLAAKEGHETIVQLLLDGVANIEANGWHNYTLLHLAALEGHETTVQLLLGGGANIEARDGDMNTPLHLAALGGHGTAVQLLLGGGASIEAKGWGGYTPLHFAAEKGHEMAVQLLLGRGANIEAGDRGMSTPLHLAASGGHETTAQLLLGRGANIDARDRGMNTPLHLAAKEGHETTVQLLLDRGVSIEATAWHNYTPLHLATQGRHKGTVQLLLDRGAGKDVRVSTPMKSVNLGGSGVTIFPRNWDAGKKC